MALPDGYRVGEELYFRGDNQIFRETRDKLCYGQRGKVVGPDSDGRPDLLSIQFPGNSTGISVKLSSLAREPPPVTDVAAAQKRLVAVEGLVHDLLVAVAGGDWPKRKGIGIGGRLQVMEDKAELLTAAQQRLDGRLQAMFESLKKKSKELAAAQEGLDGRLQAIDESLGENSKVFAPAQERTKTMESKLDKTDGQIQTVENSLAEMSEHAVNGKVDRSAFEDGVLELSRTIDMKATRLKELIDRLDAKSAFFTLYKTVPPPRSTEELFTHLEHYVEEFCLQNDLKKSEGDQWVQELKADAVPSAGQHLGGLTMVSVAGARLWTSASYIRDRKGATVELCSSLAKCNRDDNINMLVSGGIAIQKAMNSALVSRGSSHVQAWPGAGWNGRTFRGSGIDKVALQFWRLLAQKDTDEEKIYRIPAPLATSVNKVVAEGFLNKVVFPLVPVLFECQWESGQQPCLHARYIEGISAVKGEDEMLTAGYSAVQFVKIDEASSPVTITIKILKDNRAVPEYVPLASWH